MDAITTYVPQSQGTAPPGSAGERLQAATVPTTLTLFGGDLGVRANLFTVAVGRYDEVHSGDRVRLSPFRPQFTLHYDV